MLKKLTLLATVLVMTTGLAQATPKSDSVVELTAAEMDTVSAGRHHRRFTSSRAIAGSRAIALGRRTAAATRTITAAAPGISQSASDSMASSFSY